MRLGDLLIQAKLVTPQQIASAVSLQTERGGRLGDHLIAEGAITEDALNQFLHRIPVEPRDVKATGIDENELLSLLLKLIYQDRLETVRSFMDAIKLPYHIVLGLIRTAIDRQLLYTKGMRNSENPLDMVYAFTDQGRTWTIDAMQQLRYAGPCPVTLKDFTAQVNLQKLTNELVTFERIRQSVADLSFSDSIIEQAGPALNSGRAMLLYGPPGNGKTTVALRLANVFSDVIYVPYAISVEGQIIRVHDPSIHQPIPVPPKPAVDTGMPSFMRTEEFDARWIPCRRPFVVAGGELNLDMLDLRYDQNSHFYEAPLHMKVLGGCFVIDDFGRQLVSPTRLLNRWIVPLESRVDYLKLHTGKSFSIPFEELVIFSTNLEPEDLMDPAFLRRLPYKIEVGAPSLENYKRIFTKECELHGLTLTPEIFDYIVHKIKHVKELDLAAFQPRFILDQVVASCRFMSIPPQFERRFVDYAIDNLRVNRSATPNLSASALAQSHD
jgi:DNA polymerase III delta prime subunit